MLLVAMVMVTLRRSCSGRNGGIMGTDIHTDTWKHSGQNKHTNKHTNTENERQKTKDKQHITYYRKIKEA